MSHTASPETADLVLGRVYFRDGRHFLVKEGGRAEPRIPRFWDFAFEMTLAQFRDRAQRTRDIDREIHEACTVPPAAHVTAGDMRRICERYGLIDPTPPEAA